MYGCVGPTYYYSCATAYRHVSTPQLERLGGAHKELANLQDGGLGGGLSMTGLAHEAQREMADPNMVRNVLYISGTMSVLCLLLYVRSIQSGGGGVGMTPRKNASHIV